MSHSEIPKLTKGFIFNDVADDVANSTHDLGHGWQLRRATSEEIKKHAKFHLLAWAKLNNMHGNLPYNMHRRIEVSEIQINHFPPSNNQELFEHHRVMVVEATRDDSMYFESVFNAFCISDAELKVGLSTSADYKTKSSRWQEFVGFRTYFPNNVKQSLLSELDDVRDTLDFMGNLETAEVNVRQNVTNAIWLFRSLDRLPDEAALKFLGYFTVIESLLSHKPESDDPADSIAKQLKRNLKLIDNRLRLTGRTLGFEEFRPTKYPTVLKKLYDHRSSIVHGNPLKEKDKIESLPNLPKGFDLQNWMRRMVRRVLLAAVKEPQLITDLK